MPQTLLLLSSCGSRLGEVLLLRCRGLFGIVGAFASNAPLTSVVVGANLRGAPLAVSCPRRFLVVLLRGLRLSQTLLLSFLLWVAPRRCAPPTLPRTVWNSRRVCVKRAYSSVVVGAHLRGAPSLCLICEGFLWFSFVGCVCRKRSYSFPLVGRASAMRSSYAAADCLNSRRVCVKRVLSSALVGANLRGAPLAASCPRRFLVVLLRGLRLSQTLLPFLLWVAPRRCAPPTSRLAPPSFSRSRDLCSCRCCGRLRRRTPWRWP